MQILWPRNAGEIPLMLEVQYSFAAVSGINPTVELYRDTDDFIADWSANSFVASAPGSGLAIMSEVPTNNGLYRRSFNPSDFGQSLVDQTYYLRFRAIVPSGFRAGVNADISLVSHATLKFIDFVSGSGTAGACPQGMTITFTG
ncbi:hypothetical protein KAR91_50075 [Candidatus Pacearchaeota archaeon]|nr:hypothetical protein [Candidatus Pacearchaeota archaeon]